MKSRWKSGMLKTDVDKEAGDIPMISVEINADKGSLEWNHYVDEFEVEFLGLVDDPLRQLSISFWDQEGQNGEQDQVKIILYGNLIDKLQKVLRELPDNSRGECKGAVSEVL